MYAGGSSNLSIHEFWKRKTSKYMKTIKSEHMFINHTCWSEETPEKKKQNRRHRHRSSVKSIQSLEPSVNGPDSFYASYVDGYDLQRKFIVVETLASEKKSRNYWKLIWETNCRVIVRFDENDWKNCQYWLHKNISDYTEGEFNIWKKKTISHNYYTEILLTVANKKNGKSKQITHYEYHEHPDGKLPIESARLIFFLKMVNNSQENYNVSASSSNKRARKPIVIHSVGRYERAISFCALDICLNQLRETKSVSVPSVILKIKGQTQLNSFSFEEYLIINKILLHSKWALEFKTEDDNKSSSFRSRVRKYCLVFKRASVF
ncbi:tyrosine-protein phosphatase non-receptor type 9-like [Microplitis mediator]|uniref:tyrosine-protein phosphatase non-receptor type 9-like n=1 Tax=Microplitis mediator TaxID=375433 RepID=UPI0025540216|nr:tyrosine-protein phosphatase non-receptor type 9-like [Microplitis mediator]